jgi:hypothetical protein
MFNEYMASPAMPISRPFRVLAAWYRSAVPAMKTCMFVAVTALALALAACGAYKPRPKAHPLTMRASFDFNCAKKKLRYVKIDDRSYGVVGCNRQATYIEACNGGGFLRSCSWVLNGAIQDTQAPPNGARTPEVCVAYESKLDGDRTECFESAEECAARSKQLRARPDDFRLRVECGADPPVGSPSGR